MLIHFIVAAVTASAPTPVAADNILALVGERQDHVVRSTPRCVSKPGPPPSVSAANSGGSKDDVYLIHKHYFERSREAGIPECPGE